MTVQTEIVNLTTATTSLLNEVITKKSVLDEAEGKATAALDATKVSEAAAKASEIAAKTSENNAKTQADRAKTEADRASQISGLSTVSDAIGLTALPLPDVWAPLSDSLRMITGYGREVKVGEDVVSQMVNFSRSTTATYIGKGGLLRTAAANEPRFEKEGLLIEGQSTNIVTNSNVFTPYGADATKIDQQPGPSGANDATRIDTVKPYQGTNPYLSSPLVDGAVYTTSVWLRGAVGGEIIRIGIHNSTAGLGVTLTTEWKRYSVTQTRAAGTNPTFVIQVESAAVSFFVYGAQVEAAPFASSYIPTNGAAATRVADRAYILWGQNMPLSVADAVSFAVEATPYKSTAPDSRTILDLGISSASIAIDAGNTRAEIVIDNKSSRVYFGSNEVTRRIVARYDGSFLTVGNNGVIGTPTSYTADGDRPSTRYMRIGSWSANNTDWTTAQYGTYRCMWGHIRNIRIWHSALTDEQIKAIK